MHIFSFHNLLVILYHLQAENYNKTKNNYNNRNRHLILCISSSSLYDSAIINGCEFNNNIINLVFLLFVVAFHFSFIFAFCFLRSDQETFKHKRSKRLNKVEKLDFGLFYICFHWQMKFQFYHFIDFNHLDIQ